MLTVKSVYFWDAVAQLASRVHNALCVHSADERTAHCAFAFSLQRSLLCSARLGSALLCASRSKSPVCVFALFSVKSLTRNIENRAFDSFSLVTAGNKLTDRAIDLTGLSI